MHLNINFDTYLELEKISNGSFRPLDGFICEEDFYSISQNMRLNNGQLFPIPILLPITKYIYDNVKKQTELILYYNSKKVGSIRVKSIFRIEMIKHIKSLFGTEDLKHPGFELLRKMGDYFLGGPILSFFPVIYKYSNYSISPRESIDKINKLGFKTIAGFQTRNVPHRAHEYILEQALKQVDGLLIHPLIGKRKKGDFVPSAVIKSYEYLMENIYSKNQIILAAFTTYMRYAGPREAVFHALVRKNFGCTHFLVGRDHAGVGNYYGQYDAQQLCLSLEAELNIKIIKVRGPFFCKSCKKITTDKICKNIENRIDVSGTKIRKALLNNSEIKDIFMRKEIVELIRKEKIFLQ